MADLTNAQKRDAFEEAKREAREIWYGGEDKALGPAQISGDFDFAQAAINQTTRHANNKRMRIYKCSGKIDSPVVTPDSLTAHYDPESYEESYTVQYEAGMVTGAATPPVVYVQGNPRTWSFTLLFNDLGYEVMRRSDGTKSCDESLKWLYTAMLPSKVSTAEKANRPPTLLVVLSSQVIYAVLSSMNVTRTMIHPQHRNTLRATAALEFTEAVGARF